MSPIRLGILLLILTGVTLFALQNWLPVLSLVIMGTQTQALPLAVWMVGAIATGAITTLITSTLFKLFSLTASPRRRKKKNVGRVAGDPRVPWNPSSQNDDSMDVPFTVTDSIPNYVYTASSSASKTVDDDWERRSSHSEEWDNWDDYQEPVSPPIDRPTVQTTPFVSPQTLIQDQPTAPTPPNSSGFNDEKEEWEDWEDHHESEHGEFEDKFDEDEFEDDEFEEDGFDEDEFEDESIAPDQADTEPPRTIFEVQQTPKISYRSGSIYSYSYGDPNDSSVSKTESIYDANYRVIIPPYQPESEHTIETAEVDDLNQDDLNQDDCPKP